MPLRVMALGMMLCGLSAWSGEAKPEEEVARVYPTPEAVFGTIGVAARKGNWKEFHGCLTKSSGDDLTGQLASFGLVLRAYAGAEKTGKIRKFQKGLEEAFDRHGLTNAALETVREETDPAKRQRRMARLVKDQGAFCARVMQVLQFVAAKEKRSPFEEATLRDVRIDGDRATGTMHATFGGKERVEPLKFVKVDGGWRIELPKVAESFK